MRILAKITLYRPGFAVNHVTLVCSSRWPLRTLLPEPRSPAGPPGPHEPAPRRSRPRFRSPDHAGADPFPRLDRRRLVRAVLAPGRFHAGLHHGDGRDLAAEGRVRPPRR